MVGYIGGVSVGYIKEGTYSRSGYKVLGLIQRGFVRVGFFGFYCTY